MDIVFIPPVVMPLRLIDTLCASTLAHLRGVLGRCHRRRTSRRAATYCPRLVCHYTYVLLLASMTFCVPG